MPEEIYLSEMPVIESMQGKPVGRVPDEGSEPPESIRDVSFIHIKKFLTESVAFAKLRRNFWDFLNPEPEGMQELPSLGGYLVSAIKTPPQSPENGINDAAERDASVTDSESSLESCALGSTDFPVHSERYPLVFRICATFIDCILSTAEFLELREKPLKDGMKRARWQCVRLPGIVVLATKY